MRIDRVKLIAEWPADDISCNRPSGAVRGFPA